MTQYLPRPREGSSSMWSTPASGGSCSPPGSLNSLKRSECCHVCAPMPTKIVNGKLSGDNLKRQVNNFPILSFEVAFNNGEHRDLKIDDVTAMINDGTIDPKAKEIHLDVVWHHGYFRSFNNRHLEAIRNSNLSHCLVCVWPLVPDLKMPHGLQKPILLKKMFT